MNEDKIIDFDLFGEDYNLYKLTSDDWESITVRESAMFYPVYSRNAKTKSFVLKGRDYLDIVPIGTWIIWKEDDTTGTQEVQEVPEELIKALKDEH